MAAKNKRTAWAWQPPKKAGRQIDLLLEEVRAWALHQAVLEPVECSELEQFIRRAEAIGRRGKLESTVDRVVREHNPKVVPPLLIVVSEDSFPLDFGGKPIEDSDSVLDEASLPTKMYRTRKADKATAYGIKHLGSGGYRTMTIAEWNAEVAEWRATA